MTPHSTHKLAIVVSHPIQYYSPWFRHLSESPHLEIKVFYLWASGVNEVRDEKFKTTFKWDIPLLDGYEHEFLKNESTEPGTHHFRGLDNPGIIPALRKENPDALLLFGYNYKTHMAVIRSRELKGIPLIFRGDSHSLFPSTGLKSFLGRILRRRIFKRFDAVLTVGSANEVYFEENGVPPKKVFRSPHCVDNDRFLTATPEAEKEASAWRTELGIPSDHFVFLFAGKFESKKRPLDLLDAFQALTPENASLLFIGSGDHEEELSTRAGKNVFFAPFQNQSKMPRTYAMGDCFVLPSYGRGETWGLAVNETMNLAKPAIVSSHVGCGPDLIIPGETGWIFQAGNQKDLQRVMAEALSDREKTAQMGLNAREHVASFSYGKAAEAVVTVMNSLT